MARGLHSFSPGASVRRERVLPAAASALAGIVLAGIALVGCLTPPPIEEEPQEESGPVVDFSRVTPQETLIEMILPVDPDQSFSVAFAATDPDGDALSYYWYLLETETEVEVAPVTNSTSFFYRPCSSTAPRPELSEPGFRFLELDISDRPRLRTEDGQDLPEPRTYPEDAHVVTIDWVLAFSGDCP